MARRGSILVNLERAARIAARVQREAAMAEHRREREAMRTQRGAARLAQVRSRLLQQQHFVSRQEEASALTSDLVSQVSALRALLIAQANPTRAGFSGPSYFKSLPLC
jgi:hypothetical protein